MFKIYAYFKTYKGSTVPFPSCAPNTHPVCPYDLIAMFILSRTHPVILLGSLYSIDVKVFFRNVFCKVNRLLCKYAIEIHNYSGKCSICLFFTCTDEIFLCLFYFSWIYSTAETERHTSHKRSSVRSTTRTYIE